MGGRVHNDEKARKNVGKSKPKRKKSLIQTTRLGRMNRTGKNGRNRRDGKQLIKQK